MALFALLAINMKCFISLKKEKKYKGKFLHNKLHVKSLISPKQQLHVSPLRASSNVFVVEYHPFDVISLCLEQILDNY